METLTSQEESVSCCREASIDVGVTLRARWAWVGHHPLWILIL